MIKKIWTGLVVCILLSCALSVIVFAENYDSKQEYYTIDEAKANESEQVFIKRNDRFYPISNVELLYGSGSTISLDNQGFSNDDLSSIPNVFLEEGDQLVTFNHVSASAFSPVTAIYYAYPVKISIDPVYYNHQAWRALVNYGEAWPQSYVPFFNYNEFVDIYELEGKSDFQTKDEVLSILSSKNISTVSSDPFGGGCFLVSDQPASLKAGAYKGTEYIETTIQLDYHYFQYGSEIEAPVQKTHEGYFIIDLSGLGTGLYVIDVGESWSWTNKYVISIDDSIKEPVQEESAEVPYPGDEIVDGYTIIDGNEIVDGYAIVEPFDDEYVVSLDDLIKEPVQEEIVEVHPDYTFVIDDSNDHCGKDLIWDYIYESGILQISGEGDMYDYDKHNVPWDSYADRIEAVIILNGVTSIGEHAFYECENIKSVFIPNSVKKICLSAFDRCRGLTSIMIPEGVREIGGWAFASCDALTAVMLPNSLQSIGEQCFVDCKSLTSINIPSSVKKIGEWAFFASDKVVLDIEDNNSFALQYAEELGIKHN